MKYIITIAIKSHSCLKLISNVLHALEIDQSVAQLLGKGHKVLFEYKYCVIKYPNNKDVITI